MSTSGEQQERMIARALMRRPDAIVECTIDLWERLATELVSILGDGGFQSLYERTVQRNQNGFPWLAPGFPSPPGDARFASLRIALQGQDPAEAGKASIALLSAFVSVLELLIGEQLTTNILRAAWGDDAFESAAKELRE